MKNFVKAMLVAMALAEAGHSQNINWRSLGEDQRNVVQLNFGYDFGVTAQLGYSRSFTLVRPVVVGLDFSVPMGNVLVDDFKVRMGGEVEIVQAGAFSATIKIASNFRRYQTQLVRIVSFGSDFALLAGYYRTTWYAAGEFGFDKSIATNLKNSDILRAYFPEIRDGWYVPTGGHFYYGIQGGKTLGESLDLSVRLGGTRAQKRDEKAVLPYYAQLGLGVRF
jgi:hypothetical protein